MIDPILSLVFSVQSGKGVYALLLGSGVSRAAGIPTGWEMTLDLIRKLASIQGENCEPNPEIWYREEYGEEPDYSELLDQLANSSAERNQLLRSYFEPSPEEREQGLKKPTAAHQAIAELVAGGYIRVIVTTNFDHLLEKALEAVGVTPTVISTADAIQGALPLAHTQCSVIKVHGDYLDTRFKNSPSELAEYKDCTNDLLDLIFDEYGLIVCGWSAEWDTALRAAMERCKNHRFTTYWTARGEAGEKAQRLINLRRAKVISIQDADTFFSELAEKVSALNEYAQPHPLSAKLAVASLKKYLVEDRYRIRLHDLVNQETERLCGELSDDNFPVQGLQFSNNEEFVEELHNRIRHYESLAEIILALFINGCRWGNKEQEFLWVQCLQRIANLSKDYRYQNPWQNLKLYPAYLLFYAGGIAALGGKQYDTFAALLTKATMPDVRYYLEQPLGISIVESLSTQRDLFEYLPGVSRHYPLSDCLQKVLREPLREFLPRDDQYQKCFDRFECLLALIYADLIQEDEKLKWLWIPACILRGRQNYHQSCIVDEIESEVAKAGENWPPLKAGLFDGSLERFQSAKAAVEEFMKSDSGVVR